MSPFQWLWQSVTSKGVVRTLKIACNTLHDQTFDWRHGTDTARRIPADALDTGSENKTHSSCYGATKARPFATLLRKLQLPVDSTFVDIGCGKGRVLLLASEFGFRRVVGIEFASSLCAQARKNVEILRARGKLKGNIEVVEADATAYPFSADQNVLFMFNPFDGFILRQVIENIRRSLDRHPRKLWLIYNIPRHAAVIDQANLFRQCDRYELSGNEFKVYLT